MSDIDSSNSDGASAGSGTGEPDQDRADQLEEAPVDADKAAAETHGFEHDDPTDAAAAQS